jgi:hypothetical protein
MGKFQEMGRADLERVEGGSGPPGYLFALLTFIVTTTKIVGVYG